MRRLAAVALFPVTLAGCIALAWAILDAGWPVYVALGVMYPAAVVCFIAERVLPHTAAWKPERGAVITDLLHAVFSQFGGGYVAGLTVQLLASLAHLQVWPTGLPIAVQVALALVAGELLQYVWHRACHATALWRLHATHHSTHRMYWLAASRFHPLEVVLVHVMSFAPVVIAGAPIEVLALASVTGMVIGMLQHANIEQRLGPLNWVFAGPELHRWHHAAAPVDQRHNYGGIVMVWDLVFGTWYLPRSRALDPVAIGLPPGEAPFPGDYLGQLLSPVRWPKAMASATTAPSRSVNASVQPPGAA